MNRAKTLLVAALGICLLVVVAAALVPGAIADRDEPTRPASLGYHDSNVQAGAVTGETVTLLVESRIELRSGTARNVTVVHRATNTNTGLLVETARTQLGTLEDTREYTPVTNLTVPREGDYEIQSTIYVDGQRHDEGGQTVRGVGGLIPDYARTTVRFGSFPTPMGHIPPIPYFVDDTAGDTATLTVSPYLTNTGDEPEEGLELVLQARQADSNIVADQAVTDLDSIPPGRTVQPAVELTVPDDYNYRLDAMLRRDGVMVESVSMAASLDPTEEIEENVTRRDVGLETSDFERDGPSRSDSPEREGGSTTGQDGAGFGPLAAFVALVAGGLLYARRSA